MSQASDERETILIVDDEEPVRRTFREWLDGADLGCRLVAAADAEAALVLANQHTIDLAILDWNLGAGNDGLRLLEDLYVFNPDVVAIMVTGYAHQATPLDAMRMGVRDYLDKNQDLNRNTFLTAVRKQLERVRPAKRERRLQRSLVELREALDKVIGLAQTAAALNDPVPLPRAIGSLMQFLMQTTGATDGALLIRSYDTGREPPENYRAYDSRGLPVEAPLVPFARSLAGSVVGLQRPTRLAGSGDLPGQGVMEWQSFEAGRHSILAVPMEVAAGVHGVLELFDKQDGPRRPAEFTPADLNSAAAAAEFGTALLRGLAERQAHEVLLDAVGAAVRAGDPILAQLRQSLSATSVPTVEAVQTVRLAEAVRELALTHGRPAVEHCIRLIDSLRELLDSTTRSGNS